MERLRELAASIPDLRLPKDERGAAKAERAEEARIRRERDYVHHREKAHAAAEVFLTSASRFVFPIVTIDGRQVADGKPGTQTRRLRELYLDMAGARPTKT